MYIVYTGPDEVIITTPENEPGTIERYFGKDMGRDKDSYDREVKNEHEISVSCRMHLD